MERRNLDVEPIDLAALEALDIGFGAIPNWPPLSDHRHIEFEDTSSGSCSRGDLGDCIDHD